MSNLLLILSLALSACAMGLAKTEEEKVTVFLNSSTGVKGTMYHPNSEGVEMPKSHARALGLTEKDYGKTTAGEDDSSGESELKEQLSGEEGAKEEPSKPTTSPEPIPTDTPLHDKLIKDERFATVQALLANRNELTDVNGVAEKTAAAIVDHVKPTRG